METMDRYINIRIESFEHYEQLRREKFYQGLAEFVYSRYKFLKRIPKKEE